GEEVQVKLVEIDQKSGKYRLSKKALLPRPPRDESQDRERRESRGPRKD
ncbi:MAG: polyribonucleotide nucleotidyltransferase, partial [Spirosomataceae bacterium]